MKGHVLDQETIEARAALFAWLTEERRSYADTKYADGTETREELKQVMLAEGFADRWMDFAFNYIQRARMFGATTPQGRQAMGKAIVTLMHVLETAIMVHGPMPRPGVPSGVIEDG